MRTEAPKNRQRKNAVHLEHLLPLQIVLGLAAAIVEAALELAAELEFALTIMFPAVLPSLKLSTCLPHLGHITASLKINSPQYLQYFFSCSILSSYGGFSAVNL